MPDSIFKIFGIIAGILYCVDTIGLGIFIMVNYGRIISGDISVIPALLLAYGVPSGLFILGAILEAISSIGGGGRV